MLRAIVVDDEPAILEDLRGMLEGTGKVEVLAVYTEPERALEEASQLKPDCAFLDIEMAGMGGIELAEALGSSLPALEVVFVTAYNHYAAQAFEVNAMDYLLKPIRPERLGKAVDKLRLRIGAASGQGDSRCVIRCFGAFEVLADGRPIKWTRSKSKELLAYLLKEEGKWVSKYKLCDEQWSEYGPEQALAYLQTSIYALRKSLREAGAQGLAIEYADDRYRLRVLEADWDLQAFEQNYQEFVKTGSEEAAERAAGLYRGEYLEGEDWPWSEIDRQYYSRKHEELMENA